MLDAYWVNATCLAVGSPTRSREVISDGAWFFNPLSVKSGVVGSPDDTCLAV